MNDNSSESVCNKRQPVKNRQYKQPLYPTRKKFQNTHKAWLKSVGVGVIGLSFSACQKEPPPLGGVIPGSVSQHASSQSQKEGKACKVFPKTPRSEIDEGDVPLGGVPLPPSKH